MDGEKLQNKMCSWIAFSLFLSIYTFLSVRCEMPKCSHNSDFKMMFGLTIIGSIAATTVTFAYKSRT